MKNLLLTIAYDGTEFSGWQRQPDKRTVQGELERVLSTLCNYPVQINGTSRTDAGVHALAQRASFKGDFTIPVERIKEAANNLLAGGRNKAVTGDVSILMIEDVDLNFHARFDAKAKQYIYKVRNSKEQDVFERNYAYQIKKKLDIEAMKNAARHIVGTHDFKCFEAAGSTPKETTVRTIYDLQVNCKEENMDQEGRGSSGELCTNIEIIVIGDGFLYNMVRIIAGTLIDVGLGKIEPKDMAKIIEGRDRQKAGHTAPPHGLYLAKVYYE